MRKLIGRYYSYFCFGTSSLFAGIYVFFHLGYLDDPRVTPPPPPSGLEHMAFQFADDWWFALLLVLAGILLIAGVLLDSKRLRNVGLIVLAPLFGALFVAFGIRGLFDFRFNLTWVFAGLAVALLLGTAGRGDFHGH